MESFLDKQTPCRRAGGGGRVTDAPDTVIVITPDDDRFVSLSTRMRAHELHWKGYSFERSVTPASVTLRQADWPTGQQYSRAARVGRDRGEYLDVRKDVSGGIKKRGRPGGRTPEAPFVGLLETHVAGVVGQLRPSVHSLRSSSSFCCFPSRHVPVSVSVCQLFFVGWLESRWGEVVSHTRCASQE